MIGAPVELVAGRILQANLLEELEVAQNKGSSPVFLLSTA